MPTSIKRTRILALLVSGTTILPKDGLWNQAPAPPHEP
jgi:hypothetical protein